jgi:hypothetical protein
MYPLAPQSTEHAKDSEVKNREGNVFLKYLSSYTIPLDAG